MEATGLPGLWVMAGSSRAASAGRGGALHVIHRTRVLPLPPLPPLSKMISIYYTRRKDTEKIQLNASNQPKSLVFLAPQGTKVLRWAVGCFNTPGKAENTSLICPRRSSNFEIFRSRSFFLKRYKNTVAFWVTGRFAPLVGRPSRERAAIFRRGGPNGGHQSQPQKPTSVTSTI